MGSQSYFPDRKKKKKKNYPNKKTLKPGKLTELKISIWKVVISMLIYQIANLPGLSGSW